MAFRSSEGFQPAFSKKFRGRCYLRSLVSLTAFSGVLIIPAEGKIELSDKGIIYS